MGSSDMVQMYKVFISEKEVCFLSNKHFNKKGFNVFFADQIFGDRHAFLIDKLKFFDSLKIICNDLDYDMKSFFSDFKFIIAGGGLVVNENKILWIYRNNKWDLPKGKKEKNEDIQSAAIREVQEECGFEKGLSIDRFLVTTFHTYSIKGTSILKKTDWFLMNYKGKYFELIPQLEEGITKVKWVSKLNSNDLAKNTFKSVAQVWENYVKII